MPRTGIRRLLPRIRNKTSSVIIPAPLSTQQADRSALLKSNMQLEARQMHSTLENYHISPSSF
jgi:hypothetical protein